MSDRYRVSSGYISITKEYSVTKFLHYSLFSKAFFGGFALKIEPVVFVFKLIIYEFFY